MKGNIKCTITVNNLPDDFQPSGKYLVVRISEGALWYYIIDGMKSGRYYTSKEYNNDITEEG